jgi:hypothetical protein
MEAAGRVARTTAVVASDIRQRIRSTLERVEDQKINSDRLIENRRCARWGEPCCVPVTQGSTIVRDLEPRGT